MGLWKKLVCGCDDKCKGHILYSGETTIDINYKTGKIIYKKIDASQVRTREIINRAIDEVMEDEG